MSLTSSEPGDTDRDSTSSDNTRRAFNAPSKTARGSVVGRNQLHEILTGVDKGLVSEALTADEVQHDL